MPPKKACLYNTLVDAARKAIVERAIAEKGSTAAAARHLGISGPTVATICRRLKIDAKAIAKRGTVEPEPEPKAEEPAGGNSHSLYRGRLAILAQEIGDENS